VELIGFTLASVDAMYSGSLAETVAGTSLLSASGWISSNGGSSKVMPASAGLVA
jgi:hypothetical protein